MTGEEFKEKYSNLPGKPGIYKYYDQDGQILYIGKAKNLKKRVASYFTNKKYESAKTKVLVKKIRQIEYTVVNSEMDAFLLENTLIKEHQPKYNIQLKDDKSYPYICIKKERFPRVFLTRNLIKDGSKYLGPYTSVHKVRSLLNLVTTLFPLRTCKLKLSQENIEAGKFKVCLEYHIGNCMGPCEGLQSEEDYNESVNQVKNVLSGKITPVKNYLKEQMKVHADSFEFEKANSIKEKLDYLERYQGKSLIVNPSIDRLMVIGVVRYESIVVANLFLIGNGLITMTKSMEIKDRLESDLNDLVSHMVLYSIENYAESFDEIILDIDVGVEEIEGKTIAIPKIGEKKKLIDLAKKNALVSIEEKIKTRNPAKLERSNRILTTLQTDLKLPVKPFHIECIDNSNIQGSDPVASLVVFKNAKPSKKDYRHFKIKTVDGPNDFASMEEVVYRRYKRILEEGSDLPQLIIIDGGKGQLSSAIKSIKLLGIEKKLTIIGIAKKLEEIYFPGDSIPIYINKKSESLKLIQQLRNEAHRFAITFHRQLRLKNQQGSDLTNIEGIGEKTANDLLKKFKSVKKIKALTLKELSEFIGASKAKKVFNYLNTSSD